MKKLKVDYSELVDAIHAEDRKTIKKNLNELRPRLCTYLEVTMDASPEDAEDAVQEAFAEVYSKLLDNRLKSKQFFFKYLLRACRNEYLMLMRHQKRRTGNLDEVSEHLVTPSDQIKRLLDQDHQRMLEECIERLKDKYRDFAQYYCNQSEWEPKAAAKHFDIKYNYMRLIKSRTIKKLTNCVNEKMKKEEQMREQRSTR